MRLVWMTAPNIPLNDITDALLGSLSGDKAIAQVKDESQGSMRTEMRQLQLPELTQLLPCFAK
jgi:hypothetical protein